MHSSFTLSFLLAAGAAALPTTSIASTLTTSLLGRAPPGANPVLKSITSSGTGCAPNTASFFSQDAASVAFDSLILTSDDAARTKNCLITVDIGLEKGWKLTPSTAVVRGFVEVPVGVTGGVDVIYGGGGVKSTGGCALKGAVTDNAWVCTATAAQTVSSGCGGGVVTIETQVKAASGGSGPWSVAIDSEDIGFSYSKC